MASNNSSLERLDLRFRAEPAKPTTFGLPGGWVPWLLVGLLIGLGGWFYGRQKLMNHLTGQLKPKTSVAEALLAVEALRLLEDEPFLATVDGLAHQDPRVVEASYRNLDERMDQWKRLKKSDEVLDLMTSLISRLNKTGSSATPGGRALAGSLASRILAHAMNQNEQIGNVPTQLMDDCRKLIADAGTAINSDSTELLADRETSSSGVVQPPPPLPKSADLEAGAPEELGDQQFTDSSTTMVSLSDSPAEESTPNYPSGAMPLPQISRPNEIAMGTGNGANASIRLQSGRTQPRSANLLAQNTVTPPAVLQKAPVTMKIQNGLTVEEVVKLEIPGLVRALSDPNPRVAQAASVALKAKGFSDADLQLASQLAADDVDNKLSLIDDIAAGRFPGLDPRPWLIWMAEDKNPNIRRRAISYLSSMMDFDVEQELKRMLGVEEDPTVQQSIRSALGSARQVR